MDSDHHNEKSLVQVLTLEDTITSFGDEGKTIHYFENCSIVRGKIMQLISYSCFRAVDLIRRSRVA